MRHPSPSALVRLAFAVGDALRRAGVNATLTGGSCATVHTRGAYLSQDIDFVLRSAISSGGLDRAMDALGFRRDGTRYVHSRSPFFVEFLPGPLAVGGDTTVQPVELRRGRQRTLALSPTDSCRDRLAAYYHWADAGSLTVAVQIAVKHRVDMGAIAKWSEAEGARSGFDRFATAVQAARARRRRSGPRRPSAPGRRPRRMGRPL